MWQTLSFIRNHYRIPSCRYSLEKRMRPCIQHQMKKCIGPCSGDVDHDEYMQMIREIELLLEGKNRRLIESLEQRMQALSDTMRFEEAAAVRDRIRAIRSVSESQKMVSPELGDVDVIGLFRKGDAVAFKLFFIRNGVMIGTREFEQRNTAGETDGYLLRNFIEQFYVKEILPAAEVYCSGMPEDAAVLSAWLSEKRGGRVRVVVPSRGIKRKLVSMAEENAEEVLKTSGAEASGDTVREIAARLGLNKPPDSIGAFDISNIAGTSAVGAFVYWNHGGFDKARYRHIRMDAVKGPDDYGMMKEMIRRTVKSIGAGGEGQRAKTDLPDLIIIDGGKEHLNAALEAFREVNIEGAHVAGLAKEPDRIFLENRDEPLSIADSRPSSLLLRRIRDEVHRFAVRYHRKQRSRKAFESVLDSIYGLGRARRFALIERFGSIEAIKKASVGDITGLKGFTKKLAQEVLSALNAEANNKGEPA
jgi:excinuclease ABC subunit C